MRRYHALLVFLFGFALLLAPRAFGEAPSATPSPSLPPDLSGPQSGESLSGYLTKMKDMIAHLRDEFASVADETKTGRSPSETADQTAFRKSFTEKVRAFLTKVMGYDVMGKLEDDAERDRKLDETLNPDPSSRTYAPPPIAQP